MSDKKDKFVPEPVPSDELFDDVSVASSTECTGLGIIIPRDEEDAESYRDIYDIPLESGDPKKIKS